MGIAKSQFTDEQIAGDCARLTAALENVFTVIGESLIDDLDLEAFRAQQKVADRRSQLNEAKA